MSRVPEDPEYPNWEVCDIITSSTSGMEVHDINISLFYSTILLVSSYAIYLLAMKYISIFHT